MPKKEALRELQGRLAQRLQAVKEEATSTSTWLAVEAGARGFLLPLAEAGEIFTGKAHFVAVPRTVSWFIGITNLRGHLHSVIDLAHFAALRSQARSTESLMRDALNIVTFSPALETNSALLVDRLAGLRSREHLKPVSSPKSSPQPSFILGRWQDAEGVLWHELGLAALASHEAFLKIIEK